MLTGRMKVEVGDGERHFLENGNTGGRKLIPIFDDPHLLGLGDRQTVFIRTNLSIRGAVAVVVLA